MKHVVLFGSFDGLHPGHEYLLREAGKCGEVTAILALDETIRQLKGHEPAQNYVLRRNKLLESGLVKNVIESDGTLGSYLSLKGLPVDIVAFGYDQNALRENFLAWQKKTGYPAEVVVLPAFEPDIYKSSLLRKGE